MITSRTKRQLEQVDWDFSEHLPGTSKTIHWYPGTFPADIPTTIIQALSKPADIVFDPYGGTGTTALEAIRQSRRAMLVEANIVACLASYVAGGALLLKGIQQDLPKALCELVRGVVKRLSSDSKIQLSLDTDSDIGIFIDGRIKDAIHPNPKIFIENFKWAPNYSLLSSWIEKNTLKEVKALLDSFEDPSLGSFAQLLGKTMVSAILRPISSQTQSWGHIADNVRPKEFVRKDVFARALQWLSRFEATIEKTAVASIASTSAKEAKLIIAHHNWAHGPVKTTDRSIKASLLVTSPPYAGAIDYTLAQRLSFYAFGYTEEDLGSLWRTEFGARRKRNLPHSLETWAEELAIALQIQLENMSPQGYAAFVLPHKDEGRDIGTQIMEECLESLGWGKVIEVDRSIRQIRARQSWTSIKRETIHIFSK